ncbi:hypothetical protein N7457_002825 [Penicillium paradoxum]|uniref:uncharacterized protein n=1 Tax=Penicillium paradoxum TaxID=176176 RepID=UPI002548EDF0|nr:uncharacterized protein N7457_002825 [Penicillium paradoxum]KAJ5787835.1 hypothetical protein N7457_002825 [Penicillium paradoxum]
MQTGCNKLFQAQDRLEYHIPEHYDEKRPAFIFTTTAYGMGIDDHPVGSQLPKAGQDQSFLSPSSDFFAPIVCHPDSPRELADWIYTDRPQLHIHVALFEDTTLLTINYLHTFSDAISRTNFFKAWIAVLRGREEEVPAFVPYGHDPLNTLGKEAPRQSYSNLELVLSGFSLVIFGLRYMFELLWFRKLEEHPIRLPGRCVKRMRETVLQELASTALGGARKPFVSEGDVIVAWWVRTMIKALKPAPNRTIMVMNVFNVWNLFPEWFPDGAAGLIGNSFFYSYTILVANKILQDANLMYVASTNRQALVEHRTKQQVQAMTAIQRKNYRRVAPVVGDSNLLFMAATNQQKAGYFETDWSTAVVSPGVPLSERPHGLGRPSYINDIEYCRGYPTRNIVRIIGKDAAGDWHLLFQTRSEAWPVIHRELMKLIETENEDEGVH